MQAQEEGVSEDGECYQTGDFCDDATTDRQQEQCKEKNEEYGRLYALKG